MEIEHVDILTSDDVNGIQNLINDRIQYYKDKGNKFVVSNVSISTCQSRSLHNFTYTAALSITKKN